jgi:hypothetical protein
MLDYQRQMQLLVQCNYEENYFRKLKIHMKIEQTRK